VDIPSNQMRRLRQSIKSTKGNEKEAIGSYLRSYIQEYDAAKVSCVFRVSLNYVQLTTLSCEMNHACMNHIIHSGVRCW